MKTLPHATPMRLGRTLLALVILAGLAGLKEQTLGATRLVPEQYLTIQAAIDASAAGDTVLIGPGTYQGVGNRDIELRGRDLVVRSRNGPENTVIDCENAGRAFYLHEWETRAARIEGIAILNGYVPSGWPGNRRGGGIFCSLSSPTIVNCRISHCRALQGGGLALIVFEGVVDRCVISGNTGDHDGGGIWFELGEAEIKNCLITGNGSQVGAGVCFGGPGPNRLTGCTITANLDGMRAGGIYASNPLNLERCIVWGNCSLLGAAEIDCYSADIRCCDIDGTGVYSLHGVVYDEGCVFTDPMFCSPILCGWHTAGDWTLDGASACLPSHSPCGELIGALGIGCQAPLPTGACCFPSGSCLVLEASQCADQRGTYMGDQTSCDSNPCQPTPVQITTWGQIKASYR